MAVETIQRVVDERNENEEEEEKYETLDGFCCVLFIYRIGGSSVHAVVRSTWMTSMQFQLIVTFYSFAFPFSFLIVN